MKKTYRTAMGKAIDMDNLRLANEETIALGNMKVNARGDELGPGGRVARTRNQVMDEYYRLNTPTAVDTSPLPEDDPTNVKRVITPVASDLPPAAEPMSPSEASNLRGDLANSFAKK